MALSSLNGLIHRTTCSAKGLMYAVNILEKEKISSPDNKENYTCMGLDLGSSNTVVTVNNDF